MGIPLADFCKGCHVPFEIRKLKLRDACAMNVTVVIRVSANCLLFVDVRSSASISSDACGEILPREAKQFMQWLH